MAELKETPRSFESLGKMLFVVNPTAFGGAGSSGWERFQTQWPDPIESADVLVTESPGHAAELAAETEGYDILVAVGGDGTACQLLSGLMERPEPRPALAIVPAGTGNDIAHTVGIDSVEDAVAALRGGEVRSFDLIRIDCQSDGMPTHRYAFLYGAIGFSPASFGSVKPWMKRLLGPQGAYYLGMVVGLLSYRAPVMTMRWSGGQARGRTWILVAANAERVAGGSICLAPGGRPDDGLLHVFLLPGKSRANFLRKMAKFGSGSHVDEPDTFYFPVTELEVESDPPAALEMDGDALGTTPVSFRVCPRAARIVVSPTPH